MNKKHQSILAALFFSFLLLTESSSGEVIGGVEFPLGNVSFADQVVSFSLGTDSTTQTDSSQALGPPDAPPTSRSLSLGNGGVLVVEFVDNRLVDQDDVEGGVDLFVFELGPTTGGLVENFRLEISKDNASYIDLGEFQGETTGVDIKPFVSPGDEFRYVKITDLPPNTTNAPVAGADIDSIGAIGSVAVPEPSSLALCAPLLIGVTVWRRAKLGVAIMHDNQTFQHSRT